MSTKNIIIISFVVLLIIAGLSAFAFANSSSAVPTKNFSPSLISTPTNNSKNTRIISSYVTNSISSLDSVKSSVANPISETTASKPGFTQVEFQSHNFASSCYVSFQKNVYDVTGFINEHSGGAKSILKNCGKAIDSLSDLHPGGVFDGPKAKNILDKVLVETVE